MGPPEYVLGFAFDNKDNVVLIQKTKPDYQAGFLNGAGGKVEEFDSSHKAAMCREFEEEVGIRLREEDWDFVVNIHNDDWFVKIYTAHIDLDLSNLDGKPTDTDETVRIVSLYKLLGCKLLSNTFWLIGMCLDGQMPLKTYGVNFDE